MSASLTVRCSSCGTSLKLKNPKLVGREVPCPKCQERFVVTAPGKSVPEADEWDFSDMQHEDAGSAEVSSRSGAPARRQTASEARRNAALKGSGIQAKWVVAGVMVAVCLVTLGIVLMSRGGADATQKVTANPEPAAEKKSAAPDGITPRVDSTTPAAAAPKASEGVAKADEPAKKQAAAANPTASASEKLKIGELTPEKIAEREAEYNAMKNQPKQIGKPAVLASTASAATAAAAPVAAGEGSLLGKTIPEFSASAIDSTTYYSKERTEKVLVVAFMGVQCPLANLYYPRLVELAEQFKGKPVAFVAVNSNGQDTMNAVREQATIHKASFPVLKDAGSQVADAFGAERTPELFVLDEKRAVRYHGLIDDQYGYQARRKAPSRNYAAEAIASVLAGGAVKVAETPLQGCHIGRKGTAQQQAQTSFYRDVLPILQNRCQQCHRAGDIGPFALEDYESTANWGETIKEAVSVRRMPPWPADPAHGKFRDEQRLPDGELATLVKWVDEDCPEGSSADKPSAKEFVDGWNIGKPDQEFAMDKPYSVPAGGVIEYQHFVISPVFTKDVWVQAVECKYGNRSVVHHMLALLHFPKDKERSQDGLRNGYFAAGAPGANFMVFPKGQAKCIPKGAQLVLQMHYTPNGSPTKDQSRLGIILAKGPIEYEVQTYAIGTHDILIKAGDANYTKTYTEPIQKDLAISAVMPHLHLRGKSFEITATLPDGKSEKLISIPKWDFNWQYQYQLASPYKLPQGSKITVTAAWDNSDKNPNNILPPVDVKFGEQTFDEMFIGYVNFIVPRKGSGSRGARSRS